jgi:hypothetical protein
LRMRTAKLINRSSRAFAFVIRSVSILDFHYRIAGDQRRCGIFFNDK